MTGFGVDASVSFSKEQGAMLVEELVCYGVENKLIDKRDLIYIRNQLLDILNIDTPYTGSIDDLRYRLPDNPAPILDKILEYCHENGILKDNTTTHRDLFDTRIMGILTPKPSEIIDKFNSIKAEKDIKAATDYFYDLCIKSNYIRMSRIAKNIKWTYNSRYGKLEITINLTKPEKDPKEIAMLKNAPSSGYPACLLCPENTGYAGRLNHPARQNLRMLPVILNKKQWYFQYSPYVYYNEHCIVLNEKHIPMKISRNTFEMLIDFVDQFPHYFIGSNADLPIVGGSILNHDHFQGGNYTFPMEKASVEYALYSKKHPNTQAFVVHWPMSVIRLKSKDVCSLIDMAENIYNIWKLYSDKSSDILAYSYSDGKKISHNTVTPIARKSKDGQYEMDLVLRNNRTSKEHPMGIFHPHSDLHHIKKENIGLIEVMGLFILPGRLRDELSKLSMYLTGHKSINKTDFSDEANPLSKHYNWLNHLIEVYGTDLSDNEAKEVIQKEVGVKCQRVLEDAGVFKTDINGRTAFNRFLSAAELKII